MHCRAEHVFASVCFVLHASDSSPELCLSHFVYGANLFMWQQRPAGLAPPPPPPQPGAAAPPVAPVDLLMADLDPSLARSDALTQLDQDADMVLLNYALGTGFHGGEGVQCRLSGADNPKNPKTRFSNFFQTI
jgi:hypothetical protein